MHEPYALKLYIDGSAYRNPGHEGGFSVFAEYPDSFNIPNAEVVSGSYGKTTNNRMELRACIEALKFARKEVNRINIRHIVVITDSQYVYDNQNRAIYWKKDKWKNREGRPIENSDLWNEFLSARQKVGGTLEIRWELGKTSEILNSVDKGAKKSAKEGIKKTDFGFTKGKVGRTKIHGGGIPMFPARGQIAIIRIFKYEAKTDDEWKICFELFSEEHKQFILKYFAYIKYPHTDKVHRYSYYEADFNNNTQYPLVVKLKKINKID